MVRATNLLAVAAFLSACSSGEAAVPELGVSAAPAPPNPAGAGPVCPRNLPNACPSPAPGFTEVVQPIVENRCWPCHASGGPGAASGHLFSDYAHIHKDRSAILNQVYACNMPPSSALPLTTDERAALLAWLVCGAQEN